MSEFDAEDFTRAELRVLRAFSEGPPEGFVGITGLIQATGLPADRLRRILGALERDGMLTHTTEMRPVKVWRTADLPEEPA